MRYKTIFLDAGGVLVHPNWERVSQSLSQHGVSVSASRLRSAEPSVKKQIDTDEIVRSTDDNDRFSAYLRLVISEAGGKESVGLEQALTELHQYHDAWNLWETVPEDVLPTLATLRSMGHTLVVLSNANGTLRQSFERLGLLSSVDILFDSHVEGIEKPDPAFFHRAVRASGGTPETTVHVGDFYHIDVKGARNAGIHPILLDSDNLYESSDCQRIRKLAELIDVLKA